MDIECITNKSGFSMLVTKIEIFSPTVEPFMINALIDTGASVSLMTPKLLAVLQPIDSGVEMSLLGVTGSVMRKLHSYSARIGDMEHHDCMAVQIDHAPAGYEYVIGLDVLVRSGLTISPNGNHRLAA